MMLLRPGGANLYIPGLEVVQGFASGLLPFNDAFTRADGAIGNGWTGATWTISGNAAINTPGLGSELVVNGAFAADTNWTKGTGWTIAAGVAHHSTGTGGSITEAIGVIGNWYRMVWTMLNRTAGTLFGFLGATQPTGRTGNNTFTESGRQTSSTALGINSSSTGVADIDNMSAKLITLADLFATIDFARADVDVSVGVTLATNNPAGVVLNLDSTSSPANFVYGYHSGTAGVAALVKCVAGTYTTLVSVTTTYSAGAAVRVVKSGTSYDLYYNGVAVGTTQTISDAGIISNTLHGMFSCYEGSSLDDFSVIAN